MLEKHEMRSNSAHSGVADCYEARGLSEGDAINGGTLNPTN
jgi:hypothetical protein